MSKVLVQYNCYSVWKMYEYEFCHFFDMIWKMCDSFRQSEMCKNTIGSKYYLKLSQRPKIIWNLFQWSCTVNSVWKLYDYWWTLSIMFISRMQSYKKCLNLSDNLNIVIKVSKSFRVSKNKMKSSLPHPYRVICSVSIIQISDLKKHRVVVTEWRSSGYFLHPNLFLNIIILYIIYYNTYVHDNHM